MRNRVRNVAAIVGLATMAAWVRDVDAQAYFGKNQVQYEHFKWRVLETEHFWVHYYPAEEVAARDAARMAERAYARLARLLQHEFRERKPIVFFASRSDFGQNNVTGDLGEFTGGVTEALRHRILLPFTGDYASFEQVLMHEMVHEFQYDIFSRGKAGQGLQTLAQVNPPLWFAEGMAEYLSIGQYDPHASTVMRDAALNGRLPTIEQMTDRPDLYNPYDVGQALWAYIGQRWGDEVIGQILNSAPNVGIERAFKRELGLSLDELGDEWREAMQLQHLPQVATYDRARKFSTPLLTERRSGGQIFLAPALSSDGRHIAFLSNGSFLRGEVFIDLWLGDARTGKRIKRLVKSTLDPNFEELRLLYSQSAFSPNGKQLAFTAQRSGRDVLYVMDVDRRKIRTRIDLPLEGVTSPSWSPDGNQLVFSGHAGGISDLYIVDVNGENLRQLTSDKYSQMQPQWSPDGKTIAYATDYGPQTDFDLLKFQSWRIALFHLGSSRVELLEGQDGLNLNPQWAPDGRSVAYISNRTGVQNLFLFDLDAREHYQLTNVVGGVTAATQYSPAITWAHQADRLAFTYFENRDYTVWAIDNPRSLKKQPYRENPAAQVIADRSTTTTESTGVIAPSASSVPGSMVPRDARNPDGDDPRSSSYYRTSEGFRPSATVSPAERGKADRAVTVAQMLDSAAMALPDPAKFKEYRYKIRFSPDYVARPTIGYTRDNFGRGVFGGTTIILSDLLGNNRLAFAGEINGRISEARFLAAYTNLSRRFQYTAGIYQQPYYFGQGYGVRETEIPGEFEETQIITRYIERQAFGVGVYPFNRFRRAELGLQLTSIDRADLFLVRSINNEGPTSNYTIDREVNSATLNLVQPYAAFVFDNVLYGMTAPIMGHRYRLQVQPIVGNFQWVDYLADYRRYTPVIFNFLTIATRGYFNASVGRDADSLRKYIGFTDYLRGYERETFLREPCSLSDSTNFYRCSRLLGSRVALAGAELRFPLLRRVDFGPLPISLPPVEGLVFYDAGIAWFAGQKVTLRRKGDGDPARERSLLTSHGVGIRVNLYNLAILRWDYTWAHDSPRDKPFWRFSLGPSF
ncbi:MAG TPA: hypothetical protein VJ672_00610 [Gemmatimonadaceae bacterium]|nr:hypothetical protein [Gemmatimonadaceae bacterium]